MNGFFVLPDFTQFDGKNHTHVDFLALRPPGGRERCRGHELPLDQEFFATADWLTGRNSLNELVGGIVEVRGGDVREFPLDEHVAYARNFFGPTASIIRAIIFAGDSYCCSP